MRKPKTVSYKHMKMETCWRIVFFAQGLFFLFFSVMVFTLRAVDCFVVRFICLFCFPMYDALCLCVYVIFEWTQKSHLPMYTCTRTRYSTNSFQFDLNILKKGRPNQQRKKEYKTEVQRKKRSTTFAIKVYFRHGISLLCTNRTSSTWYFHCGTRTYPDNDKFSLNPFVFENSHKLFRNK